MFLYPLLIHPQKPHPQLIHRFKACQSKQILNLKNIEVRLKEHFRIGQADILRGEKVLPGDVFHMLVGVGGVFSVEKAAVADPCGLELLICHERAAVVRADEP